MIAVYLGMGLIGVLAAMLFAGFVIREFTVRRMAEDGVRKPAVDAFRASLESGGKTARTVVVSGTAIVTTLLAGGAVTAAKIAPQVVESFFGRDVRQDLVDIEESLSELQANIIVESGGYGSQGVEPVTASASGLPWFCDWRYAAGDSAAAIRGVMTPAGSGGRSECFYTITTSSGLGTTTFVVDPPSAVGTGDAFPAGITRVMELRYHTAFGDNGVMAKGINNLDTIPVGGYFALRTYDRFDAPQGAISGSMAGHPIQIGDNEESYGASGNYALWIVQPSAPASDSTYNYDIQPGQSSPGQGRGEGKFRQTGTKTAKSHRVTRRELIIYRPHLDSLRVVLYNGYDVAGTQLWDKGDFHCVTQGAVGGCDTSGGGDVLGDYAWYVPDIRMLTHLEAGQNGIDPQPSTQVVSYWGGMARKIASDSVDIIGPVPASGDSN